MPSNCSLISAERALILPAAGLHIAAAGLHIVETDFSAEPTLGVAAHDELADDPNCARLAIECIAADFLGHARGTST